LVYSAYIVVIFYFECHPSDVRKASIAGFQKAAGRIEEVHAIHTKAPLGRKEDIGVPMHVQSVDGSRRTDPMTDLVAVSPHPSFFRCPPNSGNSEASFGIET
jgi:hypothetical protein